MPPIYAGTRGFQTVNGRMLVRSERICAHTDFQKKFKTKMAKNFLTLLFDVIYFSCNNWSMPVRITQYNGER